MLVLKKCVSASITERNGLWVKLVLYCGNCETVIQENFASLRMEFTNNRQNRICGEPNSCRIYQWYTEYNFWFEAAKSSQEPIMRVLLIVWKLRLLWTFRVAWFERMVGMRYLTLLSDADTKTWTRLSEVASYWKSILIE